MNSLNDTTLESNTYMKINFEGGGLSSDAGLLLVKEFAVKVGLVKKPAANGLPDHCSIF